MAFSTPSPTTESNAAPGLESPSRPGVARLDALDGLRGIACLLVYFSHLGHNFRIGPVPLLGFTGVLIFFVLSGYLMFMPIVRSIGEGRGLPNWRRYAIRRFTRIYPPYLVALMVFTGLRYIYPGNVKRPSLENVVEHVFLVFNYGDSGYFYSINAVFWSLAIEAQFYLVLPLVVWAATFLFGHSGRVPLIAVVTAFFLMGLVFRGLEFGNSLAVDSLTSSRFWSVFSYLDLFGAGMLVALLELSLGRRLHDATWLRLGLMLGGLAVYLLMNVWSEAVSPSGWQKGDSLFYTLGFPLVQCMGVSAIIAAVVNWPGGRVPVLSWKPMVWVGTISYSIYLYHIGVELAFMEACGRLHWKFYAYGMGLFGLAILGPTLAFSALMFFLVEQPAMRWGARFSFHRSPSDVGSTEPTSDRNDNRVIPTAPP